MIRKSRTKNKQKIERSRTREGGPQGPQTMEKNTIENKGNPIKSIGKQLKPEGKQLETIEKQVKTNEIHWEIIGTQRKTTGNH